jgi:hypothetical protein
MKIHALLSKLRNSLLIAAAATGCLCPLASSPATAATVVASHTVDLTTVNLSGNSLFIDELLSAPVTLAEGDTLDFTLDFLSNQTLEIGSPNSILAGVWVEDNGDSATFTALGQLFFLGATGPVVSGALDSESGCCVHFANAIAGAQLTSGSGPISFSGIRYVALVQDFDDNTAKTYERTFFQFAGASFRIAVPEPSTWAMMLLGFGAVGFAMRRRRRVACAQILLTREVS